MKYKLFNTIAYIPCQECDLYNYCKKPYKQGNRVNTGQTDDEIEELIIDCMSSDNCNVKLVETD